jgi:hypothetical protein
MAFDPADFMSGVHLVTEMVQGGVPDVIPDLTQRRIIFDNGDGTFQEMGFNDTPMARMAIATLQLFPDAKKRWSFRHRFDALMQILDSLPPFYFRPASTPDGRDEIHPAVMKVAAKMQMGARGRFNRRRFLSEVRRLAPEDEEV